MTGESLAHEAVLADRGVVRVAGPDGGKLLGGLITNEIALLDSTPALYAALLSPQGKILFDFFVVKTGGAYLLETARDKASDLVKRLSMYKLRADVVIEDVSSSFAVSAGWGRVANERPHSEGMLRFIDPRLADLGTRILAPVGHDGAASSDGQAATPGDYHAHRIGLGVPEGGRDFDFGDTFPHEALLDQLHGVSFSKGCFVGQEIVSRMQHRTTVRKRVVLVSGDQTLPGARNPVTVGEAEIGRLGSVDGSRGLALMRIDRVAEAVSAGQAIVVDGIALRVLVPAYATFQIKAPHETA